MEARTLSLHKGGNTYVFRYAPGSESEIVDEIIRQAEDEQSELDWFDAATLSFQITQYAAAAPAESRHRPRSRRGA